jgi:hypothetical protein
MVCGGEPGIYGTLQTPAVGNIPSSRGGAVSFTDTSGNLWLFAGVGQGSSLLSDVETNPLNDVWEYRPSTTTLPATPTPDFSVSPGTYDSGGPVIIFDAMTNAVIHYTTDGTTPTTSSTLYSGPVTLSSSGTIQAIATAPGYVNSAIATAAYVITPPAATPVISVPAGTYSTPQTVTITDATPGATIEYTTNGGTTVISYSGSIVVATTETLQAYATAPGDSDSAVASASYVIAPQAATPVFSIPAGTYTTPQTVAITDATPGATIDYTVNGGTVQNQYTAPIVVSSSETLQAIAIATGYANSAPATVTYTISTATNPAPVVSSISPGFTNAGGAAFSLTVTGSGFTAGSVVYWGSSALATTYVSTTQLTAQVPAADIATGANAVAITVQTQTPGGGTSNALQFEVDSESGTTTSPTFTLTTITVSAGSAASYPVSLPSSVESASVTCLNLPAGATCSYSPTSNTLTITTASTTPKGTYQITVVFTETVSGAATAWILFPVLLLPLMFLRKKMAARGSWITTGLVLVLLSAAVYTLGCGGGGGGGTTTPITPQTHQVVSSGSVSITIQ